MRILCAGAGPAGLYFAILMKQRNRDHEVTVLERNPQGVTHGWGVVFWDDLLERLYASDPPTAEAISANAFRWSGELLTVAGREPVAMPGRGYGIGRQRLLDLLLERATALGVQVEFERAVEDPSPVPDVDLVVGADGVSSRIRQLQPDAFNTQLYVGRNKYIWLGTSKVFDLFTFAFVRTDVGWIWCHAYGFDEGASTFIAECSPETWSGLGFDELGEADTLELLETLFAKPLGGHPLECNGGAHWLNFRTVVNERWHDGNTVLLGDAAHSTHFTIGSGTKLALCDAIELAERLHDGVELDEALVAYERARQRALRPVQTDARFSARWFEAIPRYVGYEPPRLFALLHERRSPLLPRVPPRLYYSLHRATHDVRALRTVRRRAAPRIKALYRSPT
jgi:2-polyprenyl-6-methoxyphenol hydroxylase-like FAD-dependent oxidoreductase